MPDARSRLEWRSWVGVWRWAFPIGGGFALFTAFRDHASSLRSPSPLPLHHWLVGEGLVFAFWALAAPLILGLAKDFPVAGGERRLAHASIQAAAYLGLVVIYTGYYRVTERLFSPAGMEGEDLGQALYAAVSGGVLKYYLPILVGGWIAAHRNRMQEQELRNAHLQAALAREQLRALRTQIHPHFLFNTLHSISALIEADPPAADRMVMKLGALLRMSLDEAALDFVPLSRELGYIRTYLEIEETRFSDRMRVEWDIDPRTLPVSVPAFVLQPAVENAVKHGIAKSSEPGKILLRTQLAETRLLVFVDNDGPGLESRPSPEGPGLGLENLRERLTHVYGRGFELRVASRPGGGGVVFELSLPCRPAAAEAAAAPRLAPLEARAL